MNINNEFWCKVRVNKYNCDDNFLRRINSDNYSIYNVVYVLLGGGYHKVRPYKVGYNFASCPCLFLDKDFRHVLLLYYSHFYRVGIITEFIRNYPKEKIDRKKEYLRIKSEIDRLQQEKEQLFIRK